MERLQADKACASVVPRDGRYLIRQVFATCYGMTVAETRATARAIGINETGPFGYPAGFHDLDCLTMLRESLALA